MSNFTGVVIITTSLPWKFEVRRLIWQAEWNLGTKSCRSWNRWERGWRSGGVEATGTCCAVGRSRFWEVAGGAVQNGWKQLKQLWSFDREPHCRCSLKRNRKSIMLKTSGWKLEMHFLQARWNQLFFLWKWGNVLACQLHQLHLFLFLEALTFSSRCPVWKASRLADGAVTSVRLTWKSGVSAVRPSAETDLHFSKVREWGHSDTWGVEGTALAALGVVEHSGTRERLLCGNAVLFCQESLQPDRHTGRASLVILTKNKPSYFCLDGPRLWKCRPSMTLRSSIGFKNTWPWG